MGMLLHGFIAMQFRMMRDGSLSVGRFCVEAELLQKRSHELASRQEVGAEKCVATWEWRHGNRKVCRSGNVAE